ncbi:unnamed protein product [Phytomonas sp. Hart1]|nr:unnamed protein product [Phytomonas sp. Hart1]|eukprot:CCW68402.1 unnamed protein product [Phytomonas sp. isolate Hart1]
MSVPRVCRYSVSNPPPIRGPLSGNETIEEADLLDVQALQAEKAGDDTQCIQIMERSVQIHVRVVSQMTELLQGNNSNLSVHTAYNNALTSLSGAAERLAIKCNTFAVQKFKQRDFNTAESLLKYILDLTSENGSSLCETDERRCYLRSVTLNNLGCMELRRGHYPEALKYLQESMEVVGAESPIPYISISAILLQLRQCEDAASMAQRAIDLMPESPKDPSLIAVAHHNLAMSLEKISKDAALEQYEVSYRMASATLGKESPTTQLILTNWQRFQRLHQTEMMFTGRSITGQSTQLKLPMHTSRFNRTSSSQKREPIRNSEQDSSVVCSSDEVLDIFPHPFFFSQHTASDTGTINSNNKPQPYLNRPQPFVRKPLFPNVTGTTTRSHASERRPLPKHSSNQQKDPIQTAANFHTAAPDPVSTVNKLPKTFPGNIGGSTARSSAQHGKDKEWSETLPPIRKSSPFLVNVPKQNVPCKTKTSSSKPIQDNKSISPLHKTLTTKEIPRNHAARRNLSLHKTENTKEPLPRSPPQPLYNSISSSSDSMVPLTSIRGGNAVVRNNPVHTASVKTSKTNVITHPKNTGSTISHLPKRAAQTSNSVVKREAAEVTNAADSYAVSPSFSRSSKDLMESMTDRLEMLLHDEEEMERKYMKALIIQRNYRRHLTQRRVFSIRMDMNCEKRLRRIRENMAARIIQMAYRRALGNRAVSRSCRRLLKHATSSMVNTAAVRIQSMARGWAARREYLQRQRYQCVCESASTRIQNWFRSCRARQELQRLQMQKKIEEEIITRLQRWDYAASIIQKVWRAHRQLQLYREQLHQHRARRLEKERDLLYKAACKIQSAWRGFVCRRHVGAFMVVAKDLEAKRNEYQRLRNATVKIQSLCRGILVRRRTSSFLDKSRRRAAEDINNISRAHANASVIQSAYRRHLARRRLCLLKAEHRITMRECQLLALASLMQRVGRGYLFRLNLSKEVSRFKEEARRYHRKLDVLHQDNVHTGKGYSMERLYLLPEEEGIQRSAIEIEERCGWRYVKECGSSIPVDLTVLPRNHTNSEGFVESIGPKQEGLTEEAVGEVCVCKSKEPCTVQLREESAVLTITRFMQRVAAKRALARRIKAIEHLREQQEDKATKENEPQEEFTSSGTFTIVKRPPMESDLTSLIISEAVTREQEELMKLMEMESILQESEIYQSLFEEETAIRSSLPDKDGYCIDNDESVPQEVSEADESRTNGVSSKPDEARTVSIAPEASSIQDLSDGVIWIKEPIAHPDLTEMTLSNNSVSMPISSFVDDENLLKALEEERIKRSQQLAKEKQLRVQHQALIDSRQEYCMKKIYQAQTEADLIPYMRNRLRLMSQFDHPNTTQQNTGNICTSTLDSESFFLSREIERQQAAAKIRSAYRAHLFRQYLSIIKDIYSQYVSYRVDQERSERPILIYTQVDANAKESQHHHTHESESTSGPFCTDASLLQPPPCDNRPLPTGYALHSVQETIEPKQEGLTEEAVGEACVCKSKEPCTVQLREESAVLTITRFMRRVAAKRALARRIKAIEHLREQQEDKATKENEPQEEFTSSGTFTIVKRPPMESDLTSLIISEAVTREQGRVDEIDGDGEYTSRI